MWCTRVTVWESECMVSIRWCNAIHPNGACGKRERTERMWETRVSECEPLVLRATREKQAFHLWLLFPSNRTK
jgi:hypothetical protein